MGIIEPIYVGYISLLLNRESENPIARSRFCSKFRDSQKFEDAHFYCHGRKRHSTMLNQTWIACTASGCTLSQLSWPAALFFYYLSWNLLLWSCRLERPIFWRGRIAQIVDHLIPTWRPWVRNPHMDTLLIQKWHMHPPYFNLGCVNVLDRNPIDMLRWHEKASIQITASESVNGQGGSQLSKPDEE